MPRPAYFCCAIPMVNAGIYACLSEQFVLGCLAGVLAVATPTIVGGYVPTYTPYIFAGLCFILAAVQIIGFMGVFKERIRLFKSYAWSSTVAFACIFAISAALIGVSAANHTKAVNQCQTTYFAAANSTTAYATSGEGEAVCSAFAWADIGIMGGLWLVLAVLQGYMLYMAHSYSIEQKDDHEKYKSIYSANAEEFAMFERMSRFGGPNADAWDHRPSVDSLADRGGPNGEGMPYQPPGYDSYGQVPYDPHVEDSKDGVEYGGGAGAAPLASGRTNPFAPPSAQRQSSYDASQQQQYGAGQEHYYAGDHQQQEQHNQYGAGGQQDDRYADAGGYDPDQTPRPDQYGQQQYHQQQAQQYYPPQQQQHGGDHSQHYR